MGLGHFFLRVSIDISSLRDFREVHSTPASAASNNKIFLIPLYKGSISQFSARLWAPSQGPAPVEIEEMPSRSAALEVFDPALPIGGSKPITRCTAAEIRTRYDSR